MNEEMGIRMWRLERSNWVLVSLFILLVAFWAIGMGTRPERNAETIQATAFQLVNSEGEIIAELTQKDGGPGLFLKDPEGKDRVGVLLTDEQGGFFVYDKAGDSRLGAALFSHGGAGFALHGPNMKGAAVLYYKSDGTLTFYGAEGDIVLRLPSKDDHK